MAKIPAGVAKELPARHATMAETFRSLQFDPAESKSFYFVQISDSHIQPAESDEKTRFPVQWAAGYYRVTEDFQRILDEINKLAPSPRFLIHTGDLTEEGWNPPIAVQLFERAKGFLTGLKPSLTVKLIVGNHDAQPDLFQKAFSSPPYYSFDVEGVHFIALYTDGWGNLNHPGQKEWFVDDLEKSRGKELVIFAHHPPTEIETQFETYTLRQQLEEILGRHWQGDCWYICGHLHNNLLKKRTFSNVRMNMVSTANTFRQDRNRPAGYRLFCVTNNKIAASVFKGLDEPFAIDPPASQWDEFKLAFEDLRHVLLIVRAPADTKYLATNPASRTWGNRRMVANGKAIEYRIPLAQWKGRARSIALAAGGDFAAQISGDDGVWREFAPKACKGTIIVAVPLPPDLWSASEIRLRFEDGGLNPSYGFLIHGFAVMGD
ncbi:MAG: metallophosphoesterase [Verrucomicrobiae bacterium]|nr:metallophosphoesterase [Verrucomicrobiae bacterium]